MHCRRQANGELCVRNLWHDTHHVRDVAVFLYGTLEWDLKRFKMFFIYFIFFKLHGTYYTHILRQKC